MSDQKKINPKLKKKKIGNDDKTLKLPSQKGLLNKKKFYSRSIIKSIHPNPSHPTYQ